MQCEDDDELIEILLPLTMKNENKDDFSSKEKDTTIGTFSNHSEADMQEDIFFSNEINNDVQAREQKTAINATHSNENETQTHAVSSHKAEQV